MHNIRKIALMAVGGEGWQGGIQYIINIINALDHLEDQQIQITLFKGKDQQFGSLDQFSRVQLSVINIEEAFPEYSFSNKAKWLLQRKLKGHFNPRIESFLIDNGFDYVFPALLHQRVNCGSWIADFQAYRYPDGAEPEFNKNARAYLANIAENSSKLILSSKFCESDCHRFFPFTASKTFVMPFAVHIAPSSLKFSDFNSVKEKYGLPNKFLVVANMFGATKNHETLFNALGILKKEGILVHLICTGNIVDYRNLNYANEVLQMLTANQIRQQVHLVGLIPRADQLAIFRMALAMVQPSLNEGWSTSVEEAKALGKAIVLSDIDVHKEQYPGNPNFFSSIDAGDLADKIKKVWQQFQDLEFPELDRETQAFREYEQKVTAFGRNFLTIAAAGQ